MCVCAILTGTHTGIEREAYILPQFVVELYQDKVLKTRVNRMAYPVLYMAHS